MYDLILTHTNARGHIPPAYLPLAYNFSSSYLHYPLDIKRCRGRVFISYSLIYAYINPFHFIYLWLVCPQPFLLLTYINARGHIPPAHLPHQAYISIHITYYSALHPTTTPIFKEGKPLLETSLSLQLS